MPSSNFVTPSGLCRRRTVLRAVGLASVAGAGTAVLAACSPETETAAPSASPSATAESSSAAPSPSETSESASAAPSETETEEEEEAPAGLTVDKADVPVGGGVVVEEKYVVTQPSEGEFMAFSAICTHQGCPVGSVEDGEIVCPCHMSHFAIEDGAPVSGPAEEPLEEVEFTTSGDSIVIPD